MACVAAHSSGIAFFFVVLRRRRRLSICGLWVRFPPGSPSNQQVSEIWERSLGARRPQLSRNFPLDDRNILGNCPDTRIKTICGLGSPRCPRKSAFRRFGSCAMLLQSRATNSQRLRATAPASAQSFCQSCRHSAERRRPNNAMEPTRGYHLVSDSRNAAGNDNGCFRPQADGRATRVMNRPISLVF
jgi:hypothetical protein